MLAYRLSMKSLFLKYFAYTMRKRYGTENMLCVFFNELQTGLVQL